MVKAVIFDIDNTLIDFYRMKKISISEAIDAMIDAGLQINKKKAFKIIHDLFEDIGMDSHDLYQKFSKKLLGKIDHKIIAAAIVTHKRVLGGFLHTYPGVIRSLIKLQERGLKLGVVSDAPKLRAYERLYGMRILDFFDIVVTHDDTHRYKPSRRPFEHALRLMKLKPQECIMLGDWIKGDVLGAQKMGMVSCLADYGAPSEDILDVVGRKRFRKCNVKPDFTLKKFEDILKVVDKLNQSS